MRWGIFLNCGIGILKSWHILARQLGRGCNTIWVFESVRVRFMFELLQDSLLFEGMLGQRKKLLTNQNHGETCTSHFKFLLADLRYDMNTQISSQTANISLVGMP